MRLVKPHRKDGILQRWHPKLFSLFFVYTLFISFLYLSGYSPGLLVVQKLSRILLKGIPAECCRRKSQTSQCFSKETQQRNPPAPSPCAPYCYFDINATWPQHTLSCQPQQTRDFLHSTREWPNLSAASFIKPAAPEKPCWPTSVNHPCAHKHTAVGRLPTSGSCWVTDSRLSM